MGEASHSDKDEPTIISPDTLKSEHLAEGIRPIMACVGTSKRYTKEIEAISDAAEIESAGHKIEWYAHPKESKVSGFKTAGERTYVISTIDGKPKFTKALFACTSIAAVGKDVGSGAELSFLSHQAPKELLEEKNVDKFIVDLRERLEELKERCQPGTIDIVVSGGMVYNNDSYAESMKILDSVVKEVFGFSPVVIVGPKKRDSSWDQCDNIYLDTANRRLYVVRPSKSELYNNSFRANEIDEAEKSWKEKQLKNK
jgi:hypothetical protein